MGPADRLLLQTARSGGGWLVALAVAALLGAGAELLLPAVLGQAVDAALGRPTPDLPVGSWLTVTGLLVALLVLTDTLRDYGNGLVVARSTAAL
ncbi:MAG TPA: ABC transporter ATP-binding protein, partial [Micromonospora sp.]